MLAVHYYRIIVSIISLLQLPCCISWDNSQHFVTAPLVSPKIDVWGTSSETPYRWLVTTLIWVVALRHYTISMLISQTSFRRENSGNVAKCRLFSQAAANIKSLKFLNWMNVCPIPDSTLIPFQLNMKTVLIASPNPWKLIVLISPLGVAGVMECRRCALVWV